MNELPTNRLIRTPDGVIDVDLTHPHGPRVTYPLALAASPVLVAAVPGFVIDYAGAYVWWGPSRATAPLTRVEESLR